LQHEKIVFGYSIYSFIISLFVHFGCLFAERMQTNNRKSLVVPMRILFYFWRKKTTKTCKIVSKPQRLLQENKKILRNLTECFKMSKFWSSKWLEPILNYKNYKNYGLAYFIWISPSFGWLRFQKVFNCYQKTKSELQ